MPLAAWSAASIRISSASSSTSAHGSSVSVGGVPFSVEKSDAAYKALLFALEAELRNGSEE